MRKLVRKRRLWSYEVWKIEEVSHEMLVLSLQHVSSRFSGFLVASTCLWGSCRTSPFRRFPIQTGCNMSFRVAALHFVIFSRVCKSVERRFVWQKQYFCAVVIRWVAFFVAGAALSRCVAACFLQIALSGLRQVVTACKSRGRRGMLWHAMTLHTLHSTPYTLHSTLYTPHFTLYIPHSTLHTPHFTLTFHTLHSTFYTLHFTLHTLHSTLYTPHFTLYTLHSTLHTLHSTLYTQHSKLDTPHFILHTPHFTLYTPHATLHTLYFTFHTLHSTLYTPHCTLHTLHATLYTPHFTLYTLHSALYTPLSTLHTLHFTLHMPHSTLYTLHSTLYTPHFTLYTLHSTLYTPHSTLHTLHFTLYTPHSTFFIPHTLHFTLFQIPQSSVHWYGNMGKMYKAVQITCCTKVFYVSAFGFVGCILFFKAVLIHWGRFDIPPRDRDADKQHACIEGWCPSSPGKFVLIFVFIYIYINHTRSSIIQVHNLIHNLHIFIFIILFLI